MGWVREEVGDLFWCYFTGTMWITGIKLLRIGKTGKDNKADERTITFEMNCDLLYIDFLLYIFSD